MAERNLTIDNAPTRPSDRASEDLTIVMIIIVMTANRTKFLEKRRLLDRAVPKVLYSRPTKNARKAVSNKLAKKPIASTCTFWVTINCSRSCDDLSEGVIFDMYDFMV